MQVHALMWEVVWRRLVVQQGWLGMEDELRHSTGYRRAIGPEGIRKETK